ACTPLMLHMATWKMGTRPVPDLPMTFSGKLSARAIRDAVNGNPVINTHAIRNPECLNLIRNHPDLQVL
uniref:hypothetical protein n=1 Tax=Candidatus Entotheonella palauensis TaxID=93172 RepID=UPI001C4E2B83